MRCAISRASLEGTFPPLPTPVPALPLHRGCGALWDHIAQLPGAQLSPHPMQVALGSCSQKPDGRSSPALWIEATPRDIRAVKGKSRVPPGPNLEQAFQPCAAQAWPVTGDRNKILSCSLVVIKPVSVGAADPIVQQTGCITFHYQESRHGNNPS